MISPSSSPPREVCLNGRLSSICGKSSLGTPRLALIGSSTVTSNQPISCSKTAKSRWLTSASLWSHPIRRNTALTTLVHPFICHLRLSMTISTVSKVTYGPSELSIINYSLEELHGKPKLRKSLVNNCFLFQLRSYFLKIWALLLLNFCKKRFV